MIDKIQNHTRKQELFIETRMRKKTLRSYDEYSKERKERYDAYTDYVKYNNLYMVMFLKYLRNNDMTFNNLKDYYIKIIIEKSHEVLELYEGCKREKDYLDMCDIIKNDVNTVKLIYKYQK
jgi:hypothetical protein